MGRRAGRSGRCRLLFLGSGFLLGFSLLLRLILRFFPLSQFLLGSPGGGAKAPAKVMRYKDLAFKPRFAYGEMCSLAEVCGAGFGTEMGYGLARFTKARIPWAIKYDEVLMVISGVLRVRTGGRVLEAGPHDSIWLPAGTELVYEAEDALVAYAVHPIGATPGGR